MLFIPSVDQQLAEPMKLNAELKIRYKGVILQVRDPNSSSPFRKNQLRALTGAQRSSLSSGSRVLPVFSCSHHTVFEVEFIQSGGAALNFSLLAVQKFAIDPDWIIEQRKLVFVVLNPRLLQILLSAYH